MLLLAESVKCSKERMRNFYDIYSQSNGRYVASARYSRKVERKWTTRSEEGEKMKGETDLSVHSLILTGGWIRAGRRSEKFRVCSRSWEMITGILGALLKAVGRRDIRIPSSPFSKLWTYWISIKEEKTSKPSINFISSTAIIVIWEKRITVQQCSDFETFGSLK